MTDRHQLVNNSPTQNFNKTKQRLLFLLIVVMIGIAYWFLSNSGLLRTLQSATQLSAMVESIGILGPLLVIVTMTIAIIMSPLPSAPIALAAGAAYGHSWGTLYVMIGSELGAIGAFLIARLLGYDILKRWFGGKLATTAVNSQNALMGIVFVSRLLPFISFDIISYAAGLTSISFWRFALATLAGIAPASFLLAHYGSELASLDSSRIMLATVSLGALFVLPFLANTIIKRYRPRKD